MDGILSRIFLRISHTIAQFKYPSYLCSGIFFRYNRYDDIKIMCSGSCRNVGRGNS